MQDRPLDEQVDNEARVEKPTALDMETLPDKLHGAALAEGKDEVKEALKQVIRGKARHQELLEWIDDIRESEHGHGHAEKDDKNEAEVEKREGFLHDFAPDSALAAGEVDGPPPFADDFDLPGGDDGTSGGDDGGIDDDDYMFPAARRRKKAGEDDDETDDAAPSTEKTEEKAKSKKP